MSTADGILTAGKLVLTDQFRNDDVFSRFRVSNPSSIFSLVHTNQNQIDRTVGTTTSNGGSVTFDLVKSVGILSTSTSGDRAVEQSLYYPPYEPGFSKLVYITGCLNPLNASTTGIVARMGLFDSDVDKTVGSDSAYGNGWFLELSNGQLYITERTSTTGTPVDTAIVQGSWNVDPLDGTGESGITLDSTKNILLVIQIAWLGVGEVRVGVLSDGIFAVAHIFNHVNNVGPYTQTASLPVRFELENVSAGGISYSLWSCCAAVQTEGDRGTTQPQSVSRHFDTGFTTIRVEGGAIFTHVFGLRINTANRRMVLKLSKINMVATSTDSLLWRLVQGATVTGGTWNAVPNSIAETNTSATGFSGGTEIIGGFFTNTVLQVVELDLDTVPVVYSLIDGTETVVSIVITDHLGQKAEDITLSIDWIEM